MSTIYADNIQPNLQTGVSIPGHVIQVVEGTTNSQTSITTNTFTASNIAVDFQAKKVGSRVIVEISFPVWWSNNTLANYGVFAVYEDGTTNKTAAIGNWDGWLLRKPYNYPQYNNQETYSFSFISDDTDSHNYRVYARMHSTGYSMAMVDTATQGHIRITEIAQ